MRRARRPGRGISADAVLLLALVCTVAPIGWLVWNSFKLSRDIISLDRPGTFTLFNYSALLEAGSEFTTLMVNSVVVVIFTMLLCVIIGSLAAYSLSKFRWPTYFSVLILGISLFIQLVPPVALVPAFYVILSNLTLYNSVTGLILVNTIFNIPFAIFLLKVYFDSIPTELRDAALVDGATSFQAFRKVMLPLAAPGVGAVALLVAILSWNEFLMALSLTATPAAQTIPVGIASFVQQYNIRYGDMSAAATIATVPIILLATIAHRYIVAGLTGGAVKG